MPGIPIKSHKSDDILAILLLPLNRGSTAYGEAVKELFQKVAKTLMGEVNIKRTLRCEIGWRGHEIPTLESLSSTNADLPPPTMKFVTESGDQGVVTAHFDGGVGINKVNFQVTVEVSGKQRVDKKLAEKLNAIELPEAFTELHKWGHNEMSKFTLSLHPWALPEEHAKSHELTGSNIISNLFERRNAGRAQQLVLFGKTILNMSERYKTYKDKINGEASEEAAAPEAATGTTGN